jgi:cysteinyl-tRNA synthetase, unknown class
MLRLLLACCLTLPSLLVAAAPRSFAYVLQADAKFKPKSKAIETLRNCARDWIILDATYDGSTRWTRSDLAAIRDGRPNRKIVSYLSIGEAETYRPYWRKHWDSNRDGKPDRGAPGWLNTENPDWEGNYKIRYWSDGWQQIILPEIDRIMAQGFDGLYLDIVDAFEFYEQDKKEYIDNRPNPETGRTFRQDMARWVSRIAYRAARTSSNPLIIPQNAAQLLDLPEYRQSIGGIGIEDLFTNGKKLQPHKESTYTLEFLQRFRSTGKPIFIIDYSKKPALSHTARSATLSNGFVFLNTDRPLKTLGQSP